MSTRITRELRFTYLYLSVRFTHFFPNPTERGMSFVKYFFFFFIKEKVRVVLLVRLFGVQDLRYVAFCGVFNVIKKYKSRKGESCIESRKLSEIESEFGGYGSISKELGTHFPNIRK